MNKKLVLFVDDDSNLHKLMHHILDDICELTICTYPTECDDKLNTTEFSLFILDIGFVNSITNGIDLAKKIKTFELYEKTPILAFTASVVGGIYEEIIEAKNEGIFTDVISKPFESIESFRNTVKKYLQV